MRSDPTPLDILTALPTPRVWSMLVTIFGDLAQAPRDRIDGPLLTRLTDGMGIKPEAMRVALHRLRNEDWIASVKSGRTSSHALTSRGRRESEAATTLIYARPEELPSEWQIAITASGDSEWRAQMLGAGFVQLVPRVFVAHAGVMPPEDAAVLEGDEAPAWFREQLVPESLTEQFRQLLGVLHRVSVAVDHHCVDDPVTVAILRCLIVHHWRRLVLRHPYLPPVLTGAAWPGHLCRVEVCSLLDRLPRPSLPSLQAE